MTYHARDEDWESPAFRAWARRRCLTCNGTHQMHAQGCPEDDTEDESEDEDGGSEKPDA